MKLCKKCQRIYEAFMQKNRSLGGQRSAQTMTLEAKKNRAKMGGEAKANIKNLSAKTIIEQ